MKSLTEKEKAKNRKIYVAISYVGSYEDCREFKNDFIDTFKLNSVQCNALSELCRLVKEKQKYLSEAAAEGLTLDECFSIYAREYPESDSDKTIHKHS